MTVSQPERVSSDDAAGMYRLSAGALRIEGSSWVEMPGMATRAYRDSKRNWRLGDTLGPLAIIGKPEHIALYVQQHGQDTIRNDSDPEYEMTAIGVAVSRSMYGNDESWDQVRRLDPVREAMVAIVNGLTSFVPASGATEFLMGIGDLVGLGETLKINASTTREPEPTDLRQVVFAVASDDFGMKTKDLTIDGKLARGLPLKDFANGIADGLERI